MIDGGLEQLKRATYSLQRIGLSIPTIGLAKKFEEIYQLEHEKPLQTLTLSIEQIPDKELMQLVLEKASVEIIIKSFDRKMERQLN